MGGEREDGRGLKGQCQHQRCNFEIPLLQGYSNFSLSLSFISSHQYQIYHHQFDHSTQLIAMCAIPQFA